jgi:glycosyltransferase involved in cell wall biosynthesis
VGEGPDGEKLQALARDCGVAGSLLFAGFQTNPYPLLRSAAAFVLPSRWEGFPLALGEAAMLGVPAIAADCVSGPREWLDEGRYGDLVPTDDVDALATAITRHLQAPERLRNMARHGQGYVNDRYGADRAAARHLDVLKRLAGHRS